MSKIEKNIKSVEFSSLEKKRDRIITSFGLLNLTATEIDKLDNIVHQIENIQNPLRIGVI